MLFCQADHPVCVPVALARTTKPQDGLLESKIWQIWHRRVVNATRLVGYALPRNYFLNDLKKWIQQFECVKPIIDMKKKKRWRVMAVQADFL